MKLYELTDEWLALMARIDEADGVLDDETEAMLDAISGGLADKVEACALTIRTLEARAEAFATEKKRLAESERRASNSADRLRAYLLREVQKTEQRKWLCPRVTVSVQANPASVSVAIGADALPEGMRRTKVVVEPDKGAIKAALERGEAVIGCELVRSERLVLK